jgi:bacteriocin-like protein
MTDNFITLNEAELDHVSGGGIHYGPSGPPTTPGGHHWPVPRPEPQMSATSLFNNPDLYRWGTSTAKAF